MTTFTSAKAENPYSWNADGWTFQTGTGTNYSGMIVATGIDWSCIQIKTKNAFTLTASQKYLVIKGFILTGGAHNPNIYDVNGTSYKESFKGDTNNGGNFSLNTAGTLLYADLSTILPAATSGVRTISSFGITLNADKQNLPIITSIEFTEEIPDNNARLSHPCMLHTDADFQRIQSLITESPWQEAYNHLCGSSYAQSSYTNKTNQLGSDGTLKRMDYSNWGPNGSHGQYSDYNNFTALMYDAAAAYQLALRYKLSGDSQYATAAVNILNAWKNNCKGILRNDNYDWSIPDPNEYLIMIQGHQLANAAELLRDYSGWTSTDFEGFKKWMRITFLDISMIGLVHRTPGQMHSWLNWDLAPLTSVLSIGILFDDQSIIDWVVSYFKNEQGLYNEVGNIRNAVPYLHQDPDSDETLGQCQESGRDQGHATLCVSLMGVLCQTALNAGEDLFAYDDYRALKMAEYVGKYNLIKDESWNNSTNISSTSLTANDFVTAYANMPYTSYSNPSWSCPTIPADDTSRGSKRPCWELFYGYAKAKGLSAIYCKKWAEQMRQFNSYGSDGGGGDYGPYSGGFDQLGYGTLMFAVPDTDYPKTDIIDYSTSVVTAKNDGITITTTKSNTERKHILTFTPATAGEVGLTFNAEDYAVDNTQNFFVIETNSGAISNSGNFKCRSLTLDGTSYDANTGDMKALFTVGDRQVLILSPLGQANSSTAYTPVFSKFYNTADGTTISLTGATTYFTVANTNEVTIYRAALMNLGEILDTYPSLKSENWQFVAADALRLESYGNNSGASGSDGTIRIKTDNTATSTYEVFRQQMRSLGTLPANYTSAYYYRFYLEDGITPTTEDLLTPVANLQFTFAKDLIKYFPTVTPKKVKADQCYYWAYKDGVAPERDNFYVYHTVSNRIVDFTRNFQQGYNSCILPFDLDAIGLPEGWLAYTFLDYTGEIFRFKLVTDKVDANTPCLIKVPATATEGLYVIPSTNTADPLPSLSSYYPSAVSNGARFVGSYVDEIPGDTYGANKYGVDVTGELKKMLATSKTTFYRAFAALTSAQTAKGITFIDTDLSAIDNVNIGQFDNLQFDDDDIYDLSGRKIINGKWSNDQMPKGIYIYKGRKIVVK